MEVLTREFVYDDLFEMVTHTPDFTIFLQRHFEGM